MPLPDNRISWAVIQNVPRSDALKGDSFKFSEWGPEAAIEMANLVRNQPAPFLRNKSSAKNTLSTASSAATVTPPLNTGVDSYGTLGDIIDSTPKDLISKILLEEKFFETWHHGRIVLMGDGTFRELSIAVVENKVRQLTALPLSTVACHKVVPSAGSVFGTMRAIAEIDRKSVV